MNVNFRLLILCLVAFGGFLVGGESAVRVKDWQAGYSFFVNVHRNLLAQPVERIIPYRVLGWNLYRFEKGTTIIQDAQGNEYPLIKDASAFRIVVFGEGESYPPALHDLLGEQFPNRSIEVIDVSHEAYAFPHSLTLLAFDVLSWQPDLLIASHNFNDREASYFPNLLPDYSNKYGTEYFMPNEPNPFTAANYLFQWSSLYWALTEKISEWNALFSEPSRIAMSELPDAGKELFVRNLRTFIAIAQSRHVPLMLASQSINEDKTFWDTYLKNRPYRHEVAYPLHEEFLAHHRLFNELMREAAHIYRVPFVDLSNISKPTGMASRLSDAMKISHLLDL